MIPMFTIDLHRKTKLKHCNMVQKIYYFIYVKRLNHSVSSVVLELEKKNFRFLTCFPYSAGLTFEAWDW